MLHFAQTLQKQGPVCMKKILGALTLYSTFFFVIFLFTSGPVYAEEYGPFKQRDGTTVVTVDFPYPKQVPENAGIITVRLRSDQPYFQVKSGYSYAASVLRLGNKVGLHYYGNIIDAQTLEFSYNPAEGTNPRGDYTIYFSEPIQKGTEPTSVNPIATISYAVVPVGGEPKLVVNCKTQEGQPLSFQIENARAGMTYSLWTSGAWEHQPYKATSTGTYSDSFNPPDNQKKGKQTICMDLGDTNKNCRYSVNVEYTPGTPASCKAESVTTSKLPGGITTAGDPTKPFQFTGCGTSGGSGISTALGCIPTDNVNNLVGWFVKWALGIAGGVAFLLIIFAGFQIMTSTGNPDKIQGGKELLNAAISGLILIIFSVFLLKLIGVDILGLPGFG